MSVDANKAVVVKFQDVVLNERRFDLFDEVIHPDYVLNAGEKGEVRGRDAARSLFMQMTADAASRIQRLDTFGEGDMVVSRWIISGGEKRWKGITVFHLVDGKIKNDFFCSEEIT